MHPNEHDTILNSTNAHPNRRHLQDVNRYCLSDASCMEKPCRATCSGVACCCDCVNWTPGRWCGGFSSDCSGNGYRGWRACQSCPANHYRDGNCGIGARMMFASDPTRCLRCPNNSSSVADTRSIAGANATQDMSTTILVRAFDVAFQISVNQATNFDTTSA